MSCSCVGTSDDIRLDTLLRHVAPSVPEIPYGMALDLVRQAYTEFARKTNMLVYEHMVPIQRGVQNYFLEAPEGYEVFALHCFGSKNYAAYSSVRYPNYNRWFYAWGQQMKMVGNRELVLYDPPARDHNECVVTLVVLPTDCTTTIPREVATPFGKGIAAGALAEAFKLPNKAWSNASLAGKREQEFYRTIQSAKNLMLTDRGAANVMMRPVRVV